jgi:hypothetical protein
MRETAEISLVAAGWHPGRTQDVSGVRSVLESRGYSISQPVELFLQEFTGITIRIVRNGRQDSIWFDAERASEEADSEWIAYHEGRTKTSLVPIGFSNHEHLMLMQSYEGGFYGAFDDFLCALGTGAHEMIENLVNQDVEPLV